ncbi:MAG: T9SS type A sorting domain-containing protein [Bdellovibrionota bacterium]
MIRFKLDQVASVQGQWINAAGQMISITLPSTPLDRAQITVPNVPGVWILRLKTNSKTYTKRVIVQP